MTLKAQYQRSQDTTADKPAGCRQVWREMATMVWVDNGTAPVGSFR